MSNKTNLSKRRQKLSAAKQELLKKRLRGRVRKKSQSPVIPRRSLLTEIPLSFAQQRLWFLHILSKEKATYNIASAVHIGGALNLGALTQSLTEVGRRHEALRTTFPSNASGEPVQEIAPPISCPVGTTVRVPLLDLQSLPKEAQKAEVDRLVAREAQHVFDLATAPLWRVTLLRLAPDEHVLLLTMHHIISDGWSVGLLVRELSILYHAFCQNQPSPLPELPIQYADFALWQRSRTDVLQKQLSYWQQQLAGAPPVLALPTDYPRPAVRSAQGATLSFSLPKELATQLKALSTQSGSTLFMTLLTAFNVLLYRYSGQEDLLVGSPIANRNLKEIEPLIGFFANMLVLRTDLSGNPTFLQLLAQVQQVALDAYKHQDLPFEQLVEALQPERNLSHTPLFQVVFVLQNAPVAETSASEGLTLTPLERENLTAKFDLTLGLQESQGELIGWWEYSTDIFAHETIKRMNGHLRTLLSAIVANPERPIRELPLLPYAERHQLLVEWQIRADEVGLSADFIEPEANKCVHHLFAEQVVRTPERVAVVFGDQKLTYRELNERANQLAHYLQSLGIGPEVLVAIYVERSIEMVVGLLAILKAGGAYLPIDTAYPSERIAFILSDSATSVLLSQENLLQNLPEAVSVHHVVCLDKDWDAISLMSASNPESRASSENLAYIIYTSGSTGRPKGVMVPHSNVVRLFKATEAWYHFDEQDVWTLFHSVAFDFSVWELWGALLYGGRLVVVPYMVSRSPEAFYDLLCSEQVTVLNQTPSAFRQLIQAEERLEELRMAKSASQNRAVALRLIIFGGEALDLPSLAPWFERHGDEVPQLVNMYGITETTVHVTYRPLTKADTLSSGSMIGRPIPDLQLYILQASPPEWGGSEGGLQLEPVPIGVPGELYVGGAGVARGYLNRAELTQERFIDNPFPTPPQGLSRGTRDQRGAGGGANTKLYRTGDLVRYLSNGDIEYLGRIDHQVKIRGFRIELGEIEAALSQHEAVREVVVLVREEATGADKGASDKRLVAYVVCDSIVSRHVLRTYLGHSLPDYMIPAAFVQLEALPLTANGKVNRRALAEYPLSPDDSTLARKTTFIAPRSESEKELAAIWQEVLNIAQIGRHDNFFEIGGHSLLATQVISRIRETFQVALPLQNLFEMPILAELAELIDALLKQNEVKQSDEDENEDEDDRDMGEI